MRTPILILATALALGACSKGDKQADALDHAAAQADPAAAASMRNAADEIRANGTEGNLSDPNAPAQAGMANAGAAAATAPAATATDNGFGTKELVAKGPGASDRGDVPADTPGATPHKAGQPVPNASGKH